MLVEERELAEEGMRDSYLSRWKPQAQHYEGDVNRNLVRIFS